LELFPAFVANPHEELNVSKLLKRGSVGLLFQKNKKLFHSGLSTSIRVTVLKIQHTLQLQDITGFENLLGLKNI